MAVKLRLMRMGKKKQPTYRVVAADSRSPRDGRFIEIVGTYEPRRDPSVIKIDNDRAVHWLRHGAQPTERVEKLLKISGAWEAFTGEATAPIVSVAASAKATPSGDADAEPATDVEPETPAAATDEAATDEPATDEATTDEAAAADEPAADEPVADEAAAADEPIADETATETADGAQP